MHQVRLKYFPGNCLKYPSRDLENCLVLNLELFRELRLFSLCLWLDKFSKKMLWTSYGVKFEGSGLSRDRRGEENGWWFAKIILFSLSEHTLKGWVLKLWDLHLLVTCVVWQHYWVSQCSFVFLPKMHHRSNTHRQL